MTKFYSEEDFELDELEQLWDEASRVDPSYFLTREELAAAKKQFNEAGVGWRAACARARAGL